MGLDFNSGSPTIKFQVQDSGTTLSSFQLWSSGDLSDVDQYFALQATNDGTHYAGFEAQEDGGILKPKMYYATALTNLSVIEVGPAAVQISVDDFGQNTYFTPTGVGLNKSNPTATLDVDGDFKSLKTFSGGFSFVEHSHDVLGTGGIGFAAGAFNDDFSKLTFIQSDWQSGLPKINFSTDSSDSIAPSVDAMSGINMNAAGMDAKLNVTLSTYGQTGMLSGNQDNTPFVLQLNDIVSEMHYGFSARPQNGVNPGGADFYRCNAATPGLGGVACNDDRAIYIADSKIEMIYKTDQDDFTNYNQHQFLMDDSGLAWKYKQQFGSPGTPGQNSILTLNSDGFGTTVDLASKYAATFFNDRTYDSTSASLVFVLI
jgi:hypothetical protein